MDNVQRGPRGLPSPRSRLQRFLFRRQFYLQLPRIVAHRLRRGDRDRRVFVSLMGGIGDLVNLFPTIEKLSERYDVDIGTGGDPYRALVRNNPRVRRIYSPFVYKPIRRAHRTLIERVLSPFYARVILLDNFESRWWARGKHISRIVADRCGVPAPDKGLCYLTEHDRRAADDYLRRLDCRDFIYVAQTIRARRPFRSWPLRHYHDLYRMLRDRFALPILVDTAGSDEREVPGFCVTLDRLDILVAAAVIERARLFVGPDSGLTHIAGALGVPTVSIHLGYPPESCRALGDTVHLVPQPSPFDDPAATSAELVFAGIRSFFPYAPSSPTTTPPLTR